MSKTITSLFFFFVTAASSFTIAQEFSVDDVLSYSFASDLIAAQGGDRIAWIENREGERNIWVAEGPQWRGRAITSYSGDDGQELSSLTFTPDGERILYVRGGAPNRLGEVPDPLYTPAEEGRAVWIIEIDGGALRKIVNVGGFSLSPDGTQLAIARGREIELVAVDSKPGAGVSNDAANSGQKGEARRLARIRGSAGSLIWSPDGNHLAFVSNRGDHSFIGVVDREGNNVRYLDASVANDRNPVWSPDGDRIAFLRIPNERVSHLFAPRPEGLPFSIRVADVTSGRGNEIWKATDGVGSAFSPVGSSTQLFWGDGNRLVFPWEGDGWKHLYSVPVGGGPAVLLTPGAFEVQFVAISPDRRAMIYDSGQSDIDRKHIWSVPIDGSGEARSLTSGKGIEWRAVMTAAGTLAYHASSYNEPAYTVVLDSSTLRRVGPQRPASFPDKQLVEPVAVVFEAADGMAIHGQLFLPPESARSARNPALLFFHGGSRRQMLLGFHHVEYYHKSYAMNQLLANSGYVVLSVNYRSGIGYGMEFREAENYGATGASEFNDVIGAASYLGARNDVDPERIGLWGGSYGGYLTALGLARASDVFSAGVDIHGVHDWNVAINGFRPDYEPEDYPEFSRIAYLSSPMAFIDGWSSPVLLIHGDDDRNVPFSETVDLIEVLERRNVEYEQLVFPDEVHSFLLHKNWIATFEATLDFFERRLKRKRK